MAKVADNSVSSVPRIRSSRGLQPHRIRQFKLSTDPAFTAKLRDVVGLLVDEKSQILALARTLAPLPMKPGRPTTCNQNISMIASST